RLAAVGEAARPAEKRQGTVRVGRWTELVGVPGRAGVRPIDDQLVDLLRAQVPEQIAGREAQPDDEARIELGPWHVPGRVVALEREREGLPGPEVRRQPGRRLVRARLDRVESA